MHRIRSNALTFINYIMKPEVIAKASNYVYYANGNKPPRTPLLEKPTSPRTTAIYPTPEEALEGALHHRQPIRRKCQRVVTQDLDQRMKTGQ